MPFLFDIVLFTVLVFLAVVIGFVWSILLVGLSGDNDVAMTVLSLFGLVHLYRWWKQKRQDRQHDMPDPNRDRW